MTAHEARMIAQQMNAETRPPAEERQLTFGCVAWFFVGGLMLGAFGLSLTALTLFAFN